MRKQQKENKRQKKYRDVRLETHLQVADCETTPDTPYTSKKIIPFPGVSLSEPDCFQDEVDNFLQEMGYVERL